MEFIDIPTTRMLSQDTDEKLKVFHMLSCFKNENCLLWNHDQGPRGRSEPIIPYAPFTRSRVYTGTRETGSYNHHSQIAKLGDTYYLAWSNGVVNEEDLGQRILISSSSDGANWSEPVCVAGDRHGSRIHNCVALHSTGDALYLVGMSEEIVSDAASVGMRRIESASTCMDIYVSQDGMAWRKEYSFGDRIRWIFEAPRLTSEGRLLCVCATSAGQPAILLWPGTDICADPEMISVPEPVGARFPYGESSWYQTDEGRIIMFWRDEGGSCRLYINYSDDGGRNWSTPSISDIPDSMSRVYVGRLSDGRYYLCNNAYSTLLDRDHLTLLLSSDGLTFDKVYMLIDDPTSQRLVGLLKTDGYQYPCCLEEDDKLIVAYSVNKEDIECGIVDTKQI
ncbi:MAG: exo-alpha-sialidase [Armatimonadota bacterium]